MSRRTLTRDAARLDTLLREQGIQLATARRILSVQGADTTTVVDAEERIRCQRAELSALRSEL